MRSRLMQYRSDPLMQNHSGVDSWMWILTVMASLLWRNATYLASKHHREKGHGEVDPVGPYA